MGALHNPEQRWFTIYVHTCDADNGKRYVGQVVHSLQDIERGYPNVAERAVGRRWKQECRENTVLGRAIRKFGAASFRREIVVTVLGLAAANIAENEWAAKLNSYEPSGYNRRKAGLQGYKLSFEERSELCKLGWAAVPKEEKQRFIRKALETLGPEGLSLRAFRRAAGMGHEKLRAAILKGHRTRGSEGWRIAMEKRSQTMDFSAASKKAMITLGQEGRNRRARKIVESIGPDGIRERAYKTGMTKILQSLRRALETRNLAELRRLLSLGFSVSMRLPSH